jgi:hypothetical protein
MTVLSVLETEFQRRVIKAPATTAIERIASRLSPQFRKRFLAAVQAAKDGVDLEALARAIQSGSVTQAEFAMRLQEWPERYGELAIDLRAGFLAGMGHAQEMFVGSPIQLRMDLINPYAVQYAERKLPKLAKSYMENAQEIIRTIITEAVSGQYTVQGAAKALRSSIGLTQQYERAVRNLESQLLADGFSAEVVAKKKARYEAKLLKARATTIARTEIIQAQVAGQRALWDEAARNGLFDKTKAHCIWQTSFDERTCALCSAMDGQTIPYGELFDSPDLGQKNVFGEPLVEPPMHPNCRCSVKLDTKGETPLTSDAEDEFVDATEAARQVLSGDMSINEFVGLLQAGELDYDEILRLIQAGEIRGELEDRLSSEGLIT